MYLLDELYKDNENYPVDGSFIDKFLFYRKQDDDIDVDVCEQNIKIYRSLNPLIKDSAEIVKQPRDNKLNKKYEIHDGNNIYRGETIISCMQLLLQIVNYTNPEEKIYSKDIDKISNDLKLFISKNPKFENLLNQFAKKCYSEGNFFAIPFISGYSLNQAKGKLKESGRKYTFIDSSDTYFKVCYNYFTKGINCRELTEYIDKQYSVWKNRYCKKGGWESFLEDNQFHSFVDNNEPKKLWNNTNDGFIKDLENYLNLAIKALTDREEIIIKHYNEV